MDNLKEKLAEIEKKIDNLCLEKKLSIEADHMKRVKCKKNLRCYVNINTKNGLFLRLQSRVINDFKNGGELKFTDVVKRFCVVFNSDLKSTIDTYALDIEDEEASAQEMITSFEITPEIGNIQGTFYEWIKDESKPIEAFELRSEEMPKNIKLIFELENPRKIFKMSDKLSKIIMKYTETKPGLIAQMWRYIHKNGLSVPGSDIVTCDPALKDLFNVETFNFHDLSFLLTPHLCPLDYLIVDVPVLDNYSEIFDIPFEWDDLFQYPIVFPNEIISLEKKAQFLLQLKEKCEEQKEKLENFVKNPIEYINKWICLESNEICYKSAFYSNKDVQNHVFELLKRLE